MTFALALNWYIYIYSFIRVSRLHPLSFMPKSASGLVNLQLLSVIRLPCWAGTLKMGAHCTSITNRRLSKTRGWCFKKRNVTLSPLFFFIFPQLWCLSEWVTFPQITHNQIKNRSLINSLSPHGLLMFTSNEKTAVLSLLVPRYKNHYE